MKQYWVIFGLLLLVSGCGMTGQLFSGSLFSKRAGAVETQGSFSREVTFPLERRGLNYPEDKRPENPF